MAGTPLIISSALTAGSFLASGGGHLADHPSAQAATIVILLTALSLSAMAAYRAATGPLRPPPPPGPALPGLRRRIHGPRDRRT